MADDDERTCMAADVDIHWRNRGKELAGLKRGARLPVTARIVDVDFRADPTPLRSHDQVGLRLTVE